MQTWVPTHVRVFLHINDKSKEYCFLLWKCSWLIQIKSSQITQRIASFKWPQSSVIFIHQIKQLGPNQWSQIIISISSVQIVQTSKQTFKWLFWIHFGKSLKMASVLKLRFSNHQKWQNSQNHDFPSKNTKQKKTQSRTFHFPSEKNV